MARIGIDARYLENENTGVGRYSYNVLSHLLEEDTRNAYTVVIRDDYRGGLPAGENATYVRVPYAPITLSSLLTMSARVRGLDLDLWHAHFPVSPLFSGTPYLVTVHDLQPLRVPEIGAGRPLHLRVGYRVFYRLAYRYALSFAKAVVAVSVATRQEIRDCFGIPLERIHVIHEALDDRFQRPGTSMRREPEKAKSVLPDRFLLYVGATLPHKNLGNMLRGFAKALETPGREDLLLVLAGRESRFEKDSRSRTGFTGSVTWVRRICLSCMRRLKPFFMSPATRDSDSRPSRRCNTVCPSSRHPTARCRKSWVRPAFLWIRATWRGSRRRSGRCSTSRASDSGCGKKGKRTWNGFLGGTRPGRRWKCTRES